MTQKKCSKINQKCKKNVQKSSKNAKKSDQKNNMCIKKIMYNRTLKHKKTQVKFKLIFEAAALIKRAFILSD